MKHLFLSLFILLGLACPAFALDEDDLKVVHSLITESIKTSNLQLLESMIHPRGLGFLRESQFPIQLKAEYGPREFLPPFLADISRFLMTPYDSVFRVVGDTGIVCSITLANPIAKDPKTKEKGKPRYTRASYIYTKVEGKWRLLSWHTSEVPLKK